MGSESLAGTIYVMDRHGRLNRFGHIPEGMVLSRILPESPDCVLFRIAEQAMPGTEGQVMVHDGQKWKLVQWTIDRGDGPDYLSRMKENLTESQYQALVRGDWPSLDDGDGWEDYEMREKITGVPPDQYSYNTRIQLRRVTDG